MSDLVHRYAYLVIAIAYLALFIVASLPHRRHHSHELRDQSTLESPSNPSTGLPSHHGTSVEERYTEPMKPSDINLGEELEAPDAKGLSESVLTVESSLGSS